jgi:hypothetical protein
MTLSSVRSNDPSAPSRTFIRIAFAGLALLFLLQAPMLADEKIVLVYAAFDPLAGEPAISPELRAPAGSRMALLQLTGPPRQEWIDELRAAGVVFYDYVPNHTYIVRLPATQPAGSYIRWIGPLHPAYKLSSSLGGQLLIDFFPDTDLSAVESEVVATGATIVERSDGDRFKLLVVNAASTQIPKLAAIEQVRWIQKKPEYRLMNDSARWVVQSYVRDFNSIYQKGITGAGQVGAASDSGLDAYDFVNNTGAPQGTDRNDAGCYFYDDGAGGTTDNQLPPSPTHRKVVGYRVPPGATGDFTDDSDHGTHVTGSIVGDQAPWNVVSAADGQAYDARIFFQDINVGGGITVSPGADHRNIFRQAYDPNGNGVYEPDAEPRTHSNSWGGVEPIYDANSLQADDFMWTNPDFLILFAAGNQGPGPSTVGNPASAKSVVSVGATENGSANPENMADFSSHGPILVANRLKPEVGAPGAGVVSALFKNPCATQSLSGTSMATPTTQGVALLMRQYLWDGWYPKGEPDAASRIHPSAALMKAMLMNSGKPMSGLFTDNGTGGTWPSNGQGWGRILADDALYFQGDHRALFLYDEYSLAGTTDGFAAAGQSRTFTINVRNGSPFQTEPLEITLAWSDFRGATTSNGALVNNLDLVVVDPAGNAHRGNDTATNDFTNQTDLPLSSPDNANPWEVVYLQNPMEGIYTVTVTAQSLPSRAIDPVRRQGFGLVASGDLVGSRGRAEIEHDSYDVNPSAVARLRLTDVDLDTNSGAADQVTVNVSSSSNPAGISVTLTETAASSGVFTGAVTLTNGSSGGAGELLATGGNTIRITYNDANDGTGTAYVAYDTARIQGPGLSFINPPTLNDPGEETTTGTFTVSWSHAESTTNLISYEVEESTNYLEPLFDDAEGSQTASWTTDNNPPINPPWTQNPTYFHSPVQSYWSSANELVGPVDIDTSLTLNHDITIPLSVSSARLTFWSRYFNDADDTGNVEISTDGGTSWAPLLILTNASVPTADFRMQHHEIDLSSYIGAPFRIRFRFNSGPGNFVAAVTPGWWVDDVAVNAATWTRIASVPGTQTSLDVTRTENATYSYRVRGVYADATATAWSNVESIVVNRPAPVFVSDNDPAVEYNGGWHRKNDASASDGVYHVRVGLKKGSTSSASTARLVFTGDVITYFYATEQKGGTADVTIDGVLVATVSYAGTSTKPVFGQSRRFELAQGDHEIVITHRSGVAYVDGFLIESAGSPASADASAAQFSSRTSESSTDLGGLLGSLLSLSLSTSTSDVEVSVTVEGSAQPLGVKLTDALGNVVASGGALLPGSPISGVDALVSGGSSYLLQIESTAGTAETLRISITTTSRR